MTVDTSQAGIDLQIFLSYRRDDTRGYAGRVYDSLVSLFGERHVFMDVDNIGAGRDFTEVIAKELDGSDVMLALIGPNWLKCASADGRRRIDDPADFVRAEIMTALERQIPIVPLLVHDAKMPGPHELPDVLAQLALRQAYELSDNRWGSDIRRLAVELERLACDERRRVRKTFGAQDDRLFRGHETAAPATEALAAASRLVVRPEVSRQPFKTTAPDLTGKIEALASSDTQKKRVPRHTTPHASSRVAARATVFAMLVAIMSSGASAIAVDKVVTVTIDGDDRTVHTLAGDVGSVLLTTGVIPTPHDHVEPALPTPVVSGDHIILSRARRLILVEGSSQREIWTTAATVEQALDELGVQARPNQMSVSPDTLIPLSGLSLELLVSHNVTLADATGAKTPVTTTAGTVSGLLREHHIVLGPDDASIPSGDTSLIDGTNVQVIRNGVGLVTEVVTTPPPVQKIDDPTLPRGEEVVVNPGTPSQVTAIMKIYVSNGEEIRREQIGEGPSTAAVPRVVRVGTNDAIASPRAVDNGVWDRLAQCESAGNWSSNTGNGYYGGFQFDVGNWKAYGGTAYADLPSQATREEQIAIAEKVRDAHGGFRAWPACAAKLGLSR